MSTARVGIGYDSHRFADGRRLILGGVEVRSDRGLEGHSDADVVTHLLLVAPGALAAETAVRFDRVDGDKNGTAAAFATWHRAEMERHLSEAVSAPVKVKATTNEGMGWVGRGVGIAAMAVVTLDVG